MYTGLCVSILPIDYSCSLKVNLIRADFFFIDTSPVNVPPLFIGIYAMCYYQTVKSLWHLSANCSIRAIRQQQINL